MKATKEEKAEAARLIQVNGYRGILEQDGWETLELTVRGNHSDYPKAIVEETIRQLSKPEPKPKAAFVLRFNDRPYQWAHGRKPRGFGGWAFVIQEDVIWIKGACNFGEAKKRLRAMLIEQGASGYIEAEVAT
jgi:hypothetical protein